MFQTHLVIPSDDRAFLVEADSSVLRYRSGSLQMRNDDKWHPVCVYQQRVFPC